MIDWLPAVREFTARLRSAGAIENPRQRAHALAALAHGRLSFIEELQLDKALRAATEGIDTRELGLLPVRVALLSSGTVDQLLPAVRVAAVRRGIAATVMGGGFAQYRHELLERDSPLDAFGPDVIVLSLTARDFLASVPVDAGEAECARAVAARIAELRQLWRAARDRLHAAVIQQSFLDISVPVFGSLDRQVPASPFRLVARLNDALAEAAAADGILLLDVARTAARDGLDAWFDVRHWLQAKMEISPAGASRFGEVLARLLAAQFGRSRKCLVLDLDNTLWGGVVGDDGLEGIALGEGSARGEAHLALQRYARTLRDRGVILAVCSKNDPAIAEAAFRDHPEMVLRRSDFAAFVADWNDKAANLESIAAQLNIGLDSLVFVDDNPVERERIRTALPSVAVPELPADPAEYVRCLSEAGYFESVAFTTEDRQRGEQYAANAERDALRSVTGGIEEFLRNLQMELGAGPVRPVDATRTVQLINKTNQFNTTTRRISAEEFGRFLDTPGNLALTFRLRDRFGDSGLVSAMLLAPEDVHSWQICNWVMSCRVFGRQLEDEALNVAAECAARSGIGRLVAEFVPTAKNKVIADLYERLGFSCLERRDDGSSRWELRLSGFTPRATQIARTADGD